ncbi:Os11g0150801, partial [Oryza sativa Japonica Group]
GDAERRGNVRRRGAAEERPVDAAEEGVPLDHRGADGGAEAARRVLGEERRDEVLGGGGDGRLPGELERARHDVRQGHLVVVALERRHAVEQLEDEHPQRPPVDGAAVPLAGDDLRREVLVRPDERHRPELHRLRHELQLQPTGGEAAAAIAAAAARRLLAAAPAAAAVAPASWEELEARHGGDDAGRDDARRGGGGGRLAAGEGDGVRDDVRRRRRRRVALEREVEVGEHDVAVGADEHVLRLQVTVHDVHHVDVLQRRHHLRRIKPTQNNTLSPS